MVSSAHISSFCHLLSHDGQDTMFFLLHIWSRVPHMCPNADPFPKWGCETHESQVGYNQNNIILLWYTLYNEVILWLIILHLHTLLTGLHIQTVAVDSSREKLWIQKKTNKSSSLLNSINSNFHNFSHPFPSVTTLTSLGFPQVFSMFSPCFPDVFPALN
jgi:hypothetical protein